MGFFKQGAIVERTLVTTSTGGTLTLLNNSETNQVITGTSSHSIQLPNATTMVNGQRFEIISDTTGVITVKANDGSTLTTIAAGGTKIFRLVDNSSSNGTFDATAVSSSGTGVSAADLQLLRAGQAGSFSSQSRQITFNPEEVGADVWISKSSNPNTIGQQSNGFSFNGFGYNFGGTNGTPGITTNARFDDTNNYWIARTALSTASFGAGAFQGSGFGFICGGSNDTGTFAAINPGRTEQYTDSTDAWATKTALTTPQAGNVSWDFNDGYGYSAGGLNTGGSFFNPGIVQLYSIASNSWVSRPTMINPHSNVQGFVLNDLAYVCMSRENATAASERYSRSTNTWTSVASASSSEGNSLAFASVGFGYVIGGDTNSSRTRKYTDFANYWVNAYSTTTSRSSGSDGIVINSIGYTDSSTVRPMEQYRNANLVSFGLMQRFTAVPTSIVATVKLSGLTFNVPVQVRTDGDNWKTLTANSDTALKTSETLAAKFTEYGQGFVHGGNDNSTGYFSTTYRYSPEANTWATKTSSGLSRGTFAAFAIGGSAYAVSGEGTSSLVNNNQQYDEIADSFTTRAVLPASLYYVNGFALNGFGFAIGGSTTTATATSVNTNYRYNSTLDSWATKGTLGGATQNPTAVTLTGKGLRASGFNTGGSTITTTEDYSDILDTWTSRANALTSRGRTGAFSVNAAAYYFGSGGSITTNEKFDPGTNAWSTVASLNSGTFNPGCFRMGDFGYSVGGAGSSVNQQFNSAANTWTTKTALPANRFGCGVNYTPGVYRNYEVRVGVPEYIAGLGAGFWVTRSSPGIQFSGQAASLGGFGYATSFTDSFGYKHDPATDIYLKKGASTIGTHGYRTMWPLLGFAYNGMPNSGTSSVRKQFEQYDPATDLFTAKTSSTTGHGIGAGFAFNGFGYVCGGDDPGVSAVVERYNAQTNAWSNMTSMNNTREGGSSGGMLNGLGYMIGAQGAGANGGSERYNDASNAWFTITTHPVGVAYCSVAGFKGFLHANGGNTTTFVYKYSDSLNAWIKLSDANLNCSAEASYVVGNALMMMSGTGSATQQYQASLNKIVLGLSLDIA